MTRIPLQKVEGPDPAAQIETLAKRAQRDGEPFESAYARVTQDGEGRDLLLAQREADDAEDVAKRGRPQAHDPGEIRRGQIEKALTGAAVAMARDQGTSFEKAFADFLDTDAGKQLYAALRREEA